MKIQTTVGYFIKLCIFSFILKVTYSQIRIVWTDCFVFLAKGEREGHWALRTY